MTNAIAPTVYGVVGDPISHSLSPFIHNQWMRDYDINAVYAPFHLPGGQSKTHFSDFLALGVQGLNVTLPHKLNALNTSAACSQTAEAIGAANFLHRQEDSWYADNTDAEGFMMDLRRFVPDDAIKQGRILLIGAGGAARAVIYALAGFKSAKMSLTNRTAQKAHDLAAEFETGTVVPLDDALASLGGYDLVINSTSIGHGGDGFSWPAVNNQYLYDLSYGYAAETFLAPARAAGWKTMDGLGMLVGQAAVSFEKWFGIAPEIEPMIELCRKRIRQ